LLVTYISYNISPGLDIEGRNIFSVGSAESTCRGIPHLWLCVTTLFDNAFRVFVRYYVCPYIIFRGEGRRGRISGFLWCFFRVRGRGEGWPVFRLAEKKVPYIPIYNIILNYENNKLATGRRGTESPRFNDSQKEEKKIY